MAVACALSSTRAVSTYRSQSSTSVGVRRFYGVFLLGLVVVLGVFYLVQTNTVVTKGYEIKTLTTQLDALQQTSSRLQVKEAELQNVVPDNQSTSNQQFVAVSHIEYLGSTLNTSVGTSTGVGVAVR